MKKNFIISVIKNKFFILAIISPLLLYYFWISINPRRVLSKMEIEEAKKQIPYFEKCNIFQNEGGITCYSITNIRCPEYWICGKIDKEKLRNLIMLKGLESFPQEIEKGCMYDKEILPFLYDYSAKYNCLRFGIGISGVDCTLLYKDDNALLWIWIKKNQH